MHARGRTAWYSAAEPWAFGPRAGQNSKQAVRRVIGRLFNHTLRCSATRPYCADAEGTYSVMDGKQRLASLIAFYTGKSDIGGMQWDA